MKMSVSYPNSGTPEVVVFQVPSYMIPRSIHEIMVKVPDCANSVVFSLFARDEQNNVRWLVNNIPENAATVLRSVGILDKNWTIYIQASGSTGTDITIDFDFIFWPTLLE